MSDFRPAAPSAETVFLRTYSRRKADGAREDFQEAMTRAIDDIARIGKLDADEHALIMEQALNQHAFPSGRAFWVAGTEWGKKPENFSGYYNCTSTHISDLNAFHAANASSSLSFSLRLFLSLSLSFFFLLLLFHPLVLLLLAWAKTQPTQGR